MGMIFSINSFNKEQSYDPNVGIYGGDTTRARGQLQRLGYTMEQERKQKADALKYGGTIGASAWGMYQKGQTTQTKDLLSERTTGMKDVMIGGTPTPMERDFPTYVKSPEYKEAGFLKKQFMDPSKRITVNPKLEQAIPKQEFEDLGTSLGKMQAGAPRLKDMTSTDISAAVRKTGIGAADPYTKMGAGGGLGFEKGVKPKPGLFGGTKTMQTGFKGLSKGQAAGKALGYVGGGIDVLAGGSEVLRGNTSKGLAKTTRGAATLATTAGLINPVAGLVIGGAASLWDYLS